MGRNFVGVCCIKVAVVTPLETPEKCQSIRSCFGNGDAPQCPISCVDSMTTLTDHEAGPRWSRPVASRELLGWRRRSGVVLLRRWWGAGCYLRAEPGYLSTITPRSPIHGAAIFLSGDVLFGLRRRVDSVHQLEKMSDSPGMGSSGCLLPLQPPQRTCCE